MSLIHMWCNQSSWAFSASFDSQNMNTWVLLFWTLPWVSRAPLSRPKGQFPAGEKTRLYWNVAGIIKLPGKHCIKKKKKKKKRKIPQTLEEEQNETREQRLTFLCKIIDFQGIKMCLLKCHLWWKRGYRPGGFRWTTTQEQTRALEFKGCSDWETSRRESRPLEVDHSLDSTVNSVCKTEVQMSQAGLLHTERVSINCSIWESFISSLQLLTRLTLVM